MKKRYLAWMMTAVLAAGMLAGCSSQSAEITAAQETTAAETADTAEAAGDAAEKANEAENAAEEAAEAKEAEAAPEGETEEILIAAAASLKNAFEEELIPMFQEQYPSIVVKGTYDSSGKLQTQIEEGLEADVFMSAATTQMNALDEEGLIASETITDLLENKIVLIVPEGNEAGLSAFEDIANAESIALGDPASVPAGQYAEEALTNLGLWDGIQDKVSFGTNVTEVLNQVAAASADAGIVYATDAASMEDQVDVVAEAPEGSLERKVIYPVAVVKNTAHAEAAQNLVDFLKTEEAMGVFASYGFVAGNEG